jgi:hypothetical protein
MTYSTLETLPSQLPSDVSLVPMDDESEAERWDEQYGLGKELARELNDL